MRKGTAAIVVHSKPKRYLQPQPQPQHQRLQSLRLGKRRVSPFSAMAMEALDAGGRLLLSIAATLSWIGGLLPLRDPFFALRRNCDAIPSVIIRILPKLGLYTAYALAVNVISLATSLDDILHGPGYMDSPGTTIKNTFLTALDHLFHAALFATRFYFMYRARALLRLYRKIMELSARQTPSTRSVFRLPLLILLFLMTRLAIRTLLEIRYTMTVLSRPPRAATTYLQAALPHCAECRWIIHSTFIAFPYFLTAVIPIHFASSLLIPLTAVFKGFYAEVGGLEHKSQRTSMPAVASREVNGNVNGRCFQIAVTSATKVDDTKIAVPSPSTAALPQIPQSLVSRFEEIATCFREYNRIFGPMLFFLTMISVVNTINFISSLSVSHLTSFDHIILISWEVSTLCFIEIGSWAHAKIEDCQDTLRNLLLLPEPFKSTDSGTNGGGVCDMDRITAAQRICNWKWKISAGRRFFVIDRTLYATILSFMVSYSIVLLQLDATLAPQQQSQPSDTLIH